jgi:hypothetical protein
MCWYVLTELLNFFDHVNEKPICIVSDVSMFEYFAHGNFAH